MAGRPSRLALEEPEAQASTTISWHSYIVTDVEGRSFAAREIDPLARIAVGQVRRSHHKSCYAYVKDANQLLGINCTYEPRREKPGVKTGAIENIHRRLEVLERRVLYEDQDRHAWLERPDVRNNVPPVDINDGELALAPGSSPKRVTSPSWDDEVSGQDDSRRSAKHRRLEQVSTLENLPDLRRKPTLPSSNVIENVLDTYFLRIHPWIPMLHQDILREKLKIPESRKQLDVVLHAICFVTSSYLSPREASPLFNRLWSPDELRTWVVMTALNSVKLESLQALILIAFNDIGNGNALQAWPLVASLSRTVEFAQLATDVNSLQQQICQPFSCLGPAANWTEQEERRRIFWNVFLLDRFCSITMGWNTSLKSVDVHQRLPCDGGLWEKQEAGLTPYLGIWDKSTGGIGNKSRTFHDGEQPSSLEPDVWTQTNAEYASPSSQTSEPMVNMSRVGAFGYYVEATESMSRVMSYFLQQSINMDNRAEVDAWLARFKELDLRLAHWKMFLPQKWKANMPLATHSGFKMDPNLTLAHVTHNTSTILLHQVVAYPPSHWSFRRRLPSVWSRDTCLSAGIETATITEKYLELTAETMPIASPFAFYVYIAARVMIVHWQQGEENRLVDEFWSLVRCLDKMSGRWKGAGSTDGQDLAAKYAQNLRNLVQRCTQDSGFKLNVLDYTREIDYRSPEDIGVSGTASELRSHSPRHPILAGLGRDSWALQQPPHRTGDSIPHLTETERLAHNLQGHQCSVMSSTPFGVANAAATGQRPQTLTDSNGHDEGVNGRDLETAAATANLNEYFMDLDRIISFTDGSLFTTQLDNPPL